MHTPLHFISTQIWYSELSPAQLLFRDDACAFWQERIRRWIPVPHVEEQSSQSDHNVHPTVNYKNEMMQHSIQTWSLFMIWSVVNDYLFRSRACNV